METDRDKEEKMMTLLVRIDERSLNTLEQVKYINTRIMTHESDIGALQISDATRKGEAKATGRMNGILWGVGSSIFFALLSYFTGIHKQP